MGENTFTFTGLLDNPKKETNESSDFVSTVKVPRQEFAELVSKATTVEIVKKLFAGLSEYDARAAVKVVLFDEKKAEDEN